MPLKFWDETYLTTIFLINRTPIMSHFLSNTNRASTWPLLANLHRPVTLKTLS
jgi:hypothetical protein